MSVPRQILALLAAVALCLPLTVARPAVARDGALTNLSHLDFLLDEVRPGAVAGHETYRLDAEPVLQMPWTYADAEDDGSFRRVGGGAYDAATGHYSQGAYNTDDVARAAVVYLRHWRQTGDRESRTKAYELLRSVAYLQTATGANRGRSVLWIQADGTLNPSPEPVELPDPSDSGPSYWQARSVWAFGEGYAAFRKDDPQFAAFLRDRLQLSVAALNRDVLSQYRRFNVADGRRVPAWLIVDGADATAEAVLGMSAYLAAAPGDKNVRRAVARFAEGIAAMAQGSATRWPYRAILPWAQSRSLWHAWASQTGAALARAADVLHQGRLARPAVAEALSFDPTLLTAGGADNGWLPTPVERVQIAYGVDSRVQSLVAVADATGTPAAGMLAALHASWFFGANRAGAPMYSPQTGVTFDGLEADGRINPNSGAESTIHGLLTMLALDAHPKLRTLATSLDGVGDSNGLRTVEAEDASSTTGTVVTPDSAWTGESSWSAQGITAVPGALLPQRLSPVRADLPLNVRVSSGSVDLDALLVRPLLSTATFTGDRTVTLLHAVSGRQTYRTARAGEVRVFGRSGDLVSQRSVPARSTVKIPAGGLALLIDD